MIRVVTPWPPKLLSPNARAHWRKIAPIKRKFKEDCFYIAQQCSTPDFGDSNVQVYIICFPTSNRFDLDNCAASLKFGLDGIAEAWGINDRIFRPVTVDFGGISRIPRVEIIFSKHENNT